MNTKFAGMVSKGAELAADLCGGSTMERLMSQRGLSGVVSVDEYKVKHAVRNAMVGVLSMALADAAAKQGVAVVKLTDDEEKDIAAVLGSAVAPRLPARPRVRGPRAPRKRKVKEAFHDSDEECGKEDDWAKARPSSEPSSEAAEAEPSGLAEPSVEGESSGEETVVASGPVEDSEAEKKAKKDLMRDNWLACIMAPPN